MALLLFVLKWLELRLIIIEHAFEFYAGAIALLFTLLGIWIAIKIRPIRQIENKPSNAAEYISNEQLRMELAISKRELEVLQLIANGLSNQEIATQLFISPHTVKSHTARLFEKLDVKRRTHAVEKAQQLGLLKHYTKV